ncbi:hypothetical protein GALMADRAFT_235540 [Galerina marginata CBS 339.88]|uniref:Uncharacterized protein n=1 Tax=Galerina marginata (strain CBS 339.88) TaxID=685588 RepID=A0A067TU30_GALM3|nr:hypothetical protein GALMADRAFT_235540 [Galerina marginata CBS 339.88]
MSDTSSGAVTANKPPPYKASHSGPGETPTTRSKPAREHSADHLLSYYESSIPNEGRNYAPPRSPTTAKAPSSRPTHPTRKISTTSMSSDSDYSYDSETTDAKDAASEASSSVTRRSSTPSKGGADRRRVAIVQMDSVNEGGFKTSSETASTTGSIRSRRGHKSNLAGLALVAPPDAALRTYTQLTPPSTAPITGDYMHHNLLTAHQDKGHNRSASENPPSKKAPSRDTAIVGAAQGSQSSMSHLSSEDKSKKGTKDEDNSKGNVPRSNEPQKIANSRSTSPDLETNKDGRVDRIQGLLSPPYSGYPSMNAIDMFSPIVTPEIGEGKEIHVPVAAPVVLKLDNMKPKKAQSAVSWRSESPAAVSVHSSSSSYVASATSAYLHYQPGVHATAGPLPPPPRATFNIDISSPPPPRPPRLRSPSPAQIRGDIEAVKQALQLPPSVAAVLASTPPNPPIIKDDRSDRGSVNGTQDSQLSNSTPIHRREGATLSSSVTDTSSIESASSIPRESSPNPSTSASSEGPITDKKPSPPGTPAENPLDVPAVTVVEPLLPSEPKEPEKIDHKKFDQWLKENPQLAQPFDDARRAMSLDEPRQDSLDRPLSPLSADHTGEAPSPPPKSFRNSLSNNFKRISALPRTPSLSSRSGRRSSGSTRYSRTPSPSLRHAPHPSVKKIISSNPAALFCHEVHSQNTTLQRCAIYATKINELYIHDCGLSEWVVETKTRGNPQTQRGPSSNGFVPQPRQTSRSSVISEATFPIRPDASTATDLSQGAYRDITPPGLPPSLPYPSLAVNPPRNQPTRSTSSVGSGTPPSSLRSLAPTPSTKGAGFFASLGRKASLTSRKERFPPNISSPGPISPASARLTPKNNTSTMNISRPINIPNSPSVPGGPRAPPRRPQRSQTFTSSFSPPSTTERERDEPLGRRPSLFNLTLDTVIDIQPDPTFTRQVDHLAALLPHANRNVLAGYLRRAGQDMLAIGQYLEDERMGTIRQP